MFDTKPHITSNTKIATSHLLLKHYSMCCWREQNDSNSGRILNLNWLLLQFPWWGDGPKSGARQKSMSTLGPYSVVVPDLSFSGARGGIKLEWCCYLCCRGEMEKCLHPAQAVMVALGLRSLKYSHCAHYIQHDLRSGHHSHRLVLLKQAAKVTAPVYSVRWKDTKTLQQTVLVLNPKHKKKIHSGGNILCIHSP